MSGRFVCHQCGRSFAPPTQASPSTTTPINSDTCLKCIHCGSEFVEEIVPNTGARQRARDGDYADHDERRRNMRRAFNGFFDTDRAAILMDNSSSSEGEDDDHDPTHHHHHHHNPIRRPSITFGTMGNAHIETINLPGGGLMVRATTSSNDNIPAGALSIPDLIRFVLNPEAFPADHGIWRTVGFEGDPRDYVFSESAFQRALSTLMEQAGNNQALNGLSEELLDQLPRRIFGFPDSEAPTTNTIDNNGDNNADADEKRDESCAICQDAYKEGEEIVILACKHQFHGECILPWLRKVASCPICRSYPLPSK